MDVSDERIGLALDAIARTGDGCILYLYLQKVLSTVPRDFNPDADALRTLHARRMFAAELMAQMRQGVADTNGGRDPTERPIVFTGAKPAELKPGAGAGNVRAFLARNDPELTGGNSA